MIFDERYEQMVKEKLEPCFQVDGQHYKDANLFFFDGDSLGQDGKDMIANHVERLSDILKSPKLSEIYGDGQHPLTYSVIETDDKWNQLQGILGEVGGLGECKFDDSFAPYKNTAIETKMNLLEYSRLGGIQQNHPLLKKIKSPKTVFWVVESDEKWTRCESDEDFLESQKYAVDKWDREHHEPFQATENGRYKRYSMSIIDNQADFIYWNADDDHLDETISHMMVELGVRVLAMPLWAYRFDVFQKIDDFSINFADVFPRLQARDWGQYCRMTFIGRIFFANAIVQAFRCFSILNCSNIETIDNRPPPKIQKKRKKRKRPALKTYKTLKLTNAKSKADGKIGGEGAGKAFHLCRGHFKNFTEDNPLFGKYTGRYWWKSQVRGKKESGEVIKDYQKNLTNKGG